MTYPLFWPYNESEALMHISDKVKAELVKCGFAAGEVTAADEYFSRMAETGGTFGLAKQTVRISTDGRWLERVDGWNTVERDVDLRCYNDAAKAVQCVLA